LTLYQYNGKGELEYRAVDLNQNSTIDLSGTDRITQTVRDVTTYSGTDVQRTRTYVYTTDGSSATALISTVQISTDGLKTWTTV
jgi:S-adenosylmethionine/arginine decarboxylase-like enzyme